MIHVAEEWLLVALGFAAGCVVTGGLAVALYKFTFLFLARCPDCEAVRAEAKPEGIP